MSTNQRLISAEVSLEIHGNHHLVNFENGLDQNYTKPNSMPKAINRKWKPLRQKLRTERMGGLRQEQTGSLKKFLGAKRGWI